MGATFSRVKNWTTEILSNTDLNTEIDNILNNLTPSGVDDYSTNTAQMKLQTSPGGLGSESLATSLAGEFERIRYVLQRLIGGTTTYWYEAPGSTIGDLVAAIGTGLPTYRIVSGRTTGNSSQLCALIPNGTSASVVLTASVTPFVYYIGGTQYSITANQTLTGLSLAPSTNNTCSVNNTAAAGQQWTKFLGMYGTSLDVSGSQTSISTVVGQIAGFQSGNEYFMAYAESTASLTNVWRGAMFNQSASNVTAVGLTNGAEVKLMRLAWIFANTNSSLAVTYSNPAVSGTQPTSPSTGDYWFDLATTAWKTYNSTTWVAANATLIGVTMQNSAACVAARTFDSYKAMSPLNTMALERKDNTVVRATDLGAEVSVFGNTNRFGPSRPQWDITSNLESGMTETLSSAYYMYLKESGVSVVSDRAPLNRRDLYGLYHPAETWRCLGSVYNNASTNFEVPVRTFQSAVSERMIMGNLFGYNATATTTAAANAFPNYIAQGSNAASASAWSTFAASGQWADVATVALTPGVWRIQGWLAWQASSTLTQTNTYLALDSVQGTAALGSRLLNYGFDTVVGLMQNISGIYLNMQTPVMYVNMTAAGNYFLKGASDTAHANLSFIGARIQAVRFDELNGMPS